MIEIGDSIVPREASDTERHRGVIPRFVLFIFHAPSFGTLAASACATKMHFCGNGAGRSRSPTMQFFSAKSSSNRKMLDLATRHLLLALGLDPVSPSKPPSLRRSSWLLCYKRLLATVSN